MPLKAAVAVAVVLWSRPSVSVPVVAVAGVKLVLVVKAPAVRLVITTTLASLVAVKSAAEESVELLIALAKPAAMSARVLKGLPCTV